MEKQVQSSSENQALLSSGNHEVPSTKYFRSFFILSLVTLLYACAIEFEAKAMTFYLYGTFHDDSSNNETNLTVSSNESVETCPSNFTTNDNYAQTEITTWFWYMTLLIDGLQLILMIFVGVYMDHIGRKPFVLLSLCGATLYFGLETFIIYMKYSAPYFLISFTVSGMTGGSRLFGISCQTMIADLTSRNKTRSVGLVLVESLLQFGYAASQIAVGYFIKYTNYTMPCAVATGITLFCSVIVYALVPESMEKHKNKEFSFSKSFSTLTGFYRKKKLIDNGSLWAFNLAMTALIVCYIPYGVFSMLTTVYSIGPPLCWTTVEQGWFGFATGISQLAVAFPLLKLLHICLSDVSVGIIGCLSGIAKSILFAFAVSSWMLYAGTGGGVMVFTTLPTLRSIVSKMIHKDYQGALFSNFCMIELSCKLLSTTIFNNVYSATQATMRGMTFFIMAGFYFIVGVLFIPLLLRSNKGTITEDINVISQDKVKIASE